MIEKIPILLKVPVWHGRFGEIVDLLSLSLRRHTLEFVFVPAVPSDRGVVLEEGDVAGLYPHVPLPILNAQIAQFAHIEFGLWIVTGENAVDTVNGLKGAKTDPSLCDRHSWRATIERMLGRRAVRLIGEDGRPGAVIYDNFVHVPKRDEVERDLSILEKFV